MPPKKKTTAKKLFEAVTNIPGRKGRASKAGPVIEDFLESKIQRAKIDADLWGAQTASIVISLRNYIKTNGSPVNVIVRDDEVYIERTDTPRPRAKSVNMKKPGIKRKKF